MTELPIMYGLWRPGKGWVKGVDNRTLMFTSKMVAQQAATLLGTCNVYFVDQSLVDIEDQLLEAEVKRNQLPLFKRIFSFLKA